MSLRLKVIGGTPIHGDQSLCFSCRYAHIMQGPQVSDLRIRCGTNYEATIEIKKPIVTCSEYMTRTAQNKVEMEKVAWILETHKGRPIGFFNPQEHKFRTKEGKADEHDDD